MWGGKAEAMCGQHHWPVWGNERDRHHDPPAARSLQIRARPDHPPDESRPDRNRNRRNDQAAEKPGRRLACARLLRPHPAQREGDLPEISRLVRRQSGQSRSAAAGRGRQEVCRIHGRRRRDPRSRAQRISPRANFASSRRRSAIWYSPSPTTRRRARCSPIRSSSSAMPPRARPGATPICSARRSCGRACRRRRRGRRCRAKRWPRLRTGQLWDVLGVRLNGPKAEGKHIVLNWSFTDTERKLRSHAGELRADLSRTACRLRGGRELHAGARVLDEVIAKQTTFPEAVAAERSNSAATRCALAN